MAPFFWKGPFFVLFENKFCNYEKCRTFTYEDIRRLIIIENK